MVNWEEIFTAKEASLMLGKNEKYIYILWKMKSEYLLEDSVVLKGNTLLISKQGLDHLKFIHAAAEKTSNYAIKNGKDFKKQFA